MKKFEAIFISSPAGSGKTQKLAERFVHLLARGVEPQRILAITFTERAASEMKERVLKLLKEKDEALYKKVRENMHKLRISTIHSFCLSLLRRFAHEVNLDPDFDVLDEGKASSLFEDSLLSLLDEIIENRGHHLNKRLLSLLEYIEWNEVPRLLHNLMRRRTYIKRYHGPTKRREREYSILRKKIIDTYKKLELDSGIKDIEELLPPYSKDEAFPQEVLKKLDQIADRFITKNGSPRRTPPNDMVGNRKDFSTFCQFFASLYSFLKTEAARYLELHPLLEIYTEAEKRYEERKRALGKLDFDDLEILAYELLNENPNWPVVLYAFDEATDHILIDEFQDTNFLQWGIVNKLIEEWLSGYGAKTDIGRKTSIFLVGDEKQSIYLFRGANVEVFHKVREILSKWLGDSFRYEIEKKNYRSLSSIIDFTNEVFPEIMQKKQEGELWRTTYTPFQRARENKDRGLVGVFLLPLEEEKEEEKRRKEAELVARIIISYLGKEVVYNGKEEKKPLSFGDIALLLRRRTHLRQYEEAFRKYRIPFVVVKGIGFYEEPEIILLSNLIYFLSNPSDSFSLYSILASPLFEIEKELLGKLVSFEGGTLFEKIRKCKEFEEISALLSSWVEKARRGNLSHLLEEIIEERELLKYFHEVQKTLNIKKFLRIIEGYEREGMLISEIEERLRKSERREQEAKASISADFMDAVKIMTIHAAKGLQFPFVIISEIDSWMTPGKEERFIIEEEENSTELLLMPKGGIKKSHPLHSLYIDKLVEEEKRIFYVAVTRARDVLLMTGVYEIKDKKKGDRRKVAPLEYLSKHFEISYKNGKFNYKKKLEGFFIKSGDEVGAHKKEIELKAKEKPSLLHTGEIGWRSEFVIERVTDEELPVRVRKGDPYFGEALHFLLESMGKERREFSGEEIESRIRVFLSRKGIYGKEADLRVEEASKHIKKLKSSRIIESIVLREGQGGYEIPFILIKEGKAYSGRIDRVIVEGEKVIVYDYKTSSFASESEIEELIKNSLHQISIYCEAAREIYMKEQAEGYLILTERGEVRRVI